MAKACDRMALVAAATAVAVTVGSAQDWNQWRGPSRTGVAIAFKPPASWPDRPTRVLLVSGGDPPVDPSVVVHQVPAADQYRVQADAFSRAIRDDTPVPTPPQDAVANIEVMERIFADAAARA